MNPPLSGAEMGFLHAAQTRIGHKPTDVLDSLLSPFDHCTESIDLTDVDLPTLARTHHTESTPHSPSPLQAHTRKLPPFTHQFPDNSPHLNEAFDLRTYLHRSSNYPLAARLVIAGGSFLGAVDDIILRRRLGSNLRRLPPFVSDQIGTNARHLSPLEDAVQRRILEVYPRIASHKLAADEELAALALFFLISAAIFRQSHALNTLREHLPAALKPFFEKFHHALLSTKKPELGLFFARYFHCLENSHDDQTS